MIVIIVITIIIVIIITIVIVSPPYYTQVYHTCTILHIYIYTRGRARSGCSGETTTVFARSTKKTLQHEKRRYTAAVSRRDAGRQGRARDNDTHGVKYDCQ